jgi:hypothetical protein
VIGKGRRIRYFVNNLESLTDVEVVETFRSTPHCRITLGISSVVMCNTAVEDEIQICRDEYYVSITVIFPYLLVLLIECQRLNKRVWIGHCFHGMMELSNVSSF